MKNQLVAPNNSEPNQRGFRLALACLFLFLPVVAPANAQRINGTPGYIVADERDVVRVRTNYRHEQLAALGLAVKCRQSLGAMQLRELTYWTKVQ